MIQFIIIPIFLFFLCFIVGSFGNQERGSSEKIILGYVFVLAIFHIISIPLLYIEAKFTILFYFSVLLLGICFIAYIVKKIRQKNGMRSDAHLSIKEKYEVCSKKRLLLWVGIIALIGIQVFYIVYFQHSDGDDSFYIAQINTILERNRLLDVDPSTGLEKFQLMSTYKLVSYEVLLSVVAEIFHVNPAFLCHTILPVFLIPLHYIVVYELGKSIRYEQKELFLLFCIVLNICSGFSGCTEGAFLALRIWQGKSVLANIILPILLLEFVNIYKRKYVKKRELLLLFAILMSGFHTTSVGLYLIPIAYFAYTVIYFIKYRDIKGSVKLCIPIFLSLPYVVLKLQVLLSSGTMTNITQGEEEFTFLGEFYDKFLNQNIIFLLLVGCLSVYIVKKGSVVEKTALIYPGIVLLVTFLNPFLSFFIAKSVTGVSVYWRMFWLLEFRFIIVIGALIYFSYETSKKIVSLIAVLFAISGSGKVIYNDSFFTERENRYKIQDQSIWIADAIIEDSDNRVKNLLIPGESNWEIRQYTGKVQLAWGRYTEDLYNMYDKENYDGLKKLHTQLYKDKEWDEEEVERLLDKYEIDYLYVYNDSLKKNTLPDHLEAIKKENIYTIYRVGENK